MKVINWRLRLKEENMVMRKEKLSRKRIRLGIQIDEGLIKKKIREGLIDAISDLFQKQSNNRTRS